MPGRRIAAIRLFVQEWILFFFSCQGFDYDNGAAMSLGITDGFSIIFLC